jgi:LPS O-antigen subunit length determinant protein (WzzB/FepE family)
MENNLTNNKNIDIQLDEFFSILYNKKSLILILTTIFAIVSVLISLNIPNTYTSKSVLVPVESSNSMSSMSSSLSSAASMIGFGVSGNNNSIKIEEAIKRMESFDFFNNYFLKNVQLENIMAVKKWDSEKNQIIYDGSLYDSEKKIWILNNSKKTKPSSRDAYEIYIERLAISSNSQFIDISIKHESPLVAKRWLDLIITNINESMREDDKINAENAITFLNKSLKNTKLQSIKTVTSNLLESQMKTLMLAESSESYVLKIIDSPFVPEKKSSPNRALICILGTALGFILGIFISMIMFFRERYSH